MNTPNQWKVVESPHRLEVVGGVGGGTVCIGSTALSFKPHRQGSHRGEKMVYRAFTADDRLKAHLLAAAPDLLAALKGILAARPELWGDSVVNGRTVLTIDEDAAFAADAAIAKAEGR